MQAVTPCLEVTDAILDVGGATLQICMQCGTCTTVCPWTEVRDYSPRSLLRQLSLGMEGAEDEALWTCVTCNTCVVRCPRGVDLIDVVRSARAVMAETGVQPSSYGAPLASLRTDGNPWAGDRVQRAAWQMGLDVPAFVSGIDWLLFTCCTQAYDARNSRVARALVGLLREAGLSFGSLKEAESCCGDLPSKAGAMEVTEGLRETNTDLFTEKAVAHMIVASPHCMNTFRKDYDEAVRQIDTVHHTVLLNDLLCTGKLVPRRKVARRVTYHDPCYLGRHNGIYDEPRAILEAIPGLVLAEMGRCRDHALCCGGGGGGLWAEVPINERFAVLRVKEALATGAEVLAAACPLCIAMFEDAIKVLELEDRLQVKDVAELLFEAVSQEV